MSFCLLCGWGNISRLGVFRSLLREGREFRVGFSEPLRASAKSESARKKVCLAQMTQIGPGDLNRPRIGPKSSESLKSLNNVPELSELSELILSRLMSSESSESSEPSEP